ncbi:MAG: D-alanyl-D-alanine carboxypeptidase family protein, partial [Alphaproteobacteria bacterium]
IAMALGEAVAGSEPMFVSRMNAEAARLGMTRTRFVNPHGLPDKRQVTTVRDMAVLARALKMEFPQYGDYFKISAIRIGKKTLTNYNTLVNYYRGATGMKTGYICASGFNLVASAKRGNRELIAVVFGARNSVDRGEAAAGLLNKGFKRGLLTGVTSKTLETVNSGARYTTPYNMRPHLCVRKTKAQRAADGPRPRYRKQASGQLMVARGGKLKKSKMGRARKLPIARVFTGGATAVAWIPPLPRVRPVTKSADVMAASAEQTRSEPVASANKTLIPGTVAPKMAAAFAPIKPSVAASGSLIAGDAASAASAIAGPSVPLPRPRPN